MNSYNEIELYLRIMYEFKERFTSISLMCRELYKKDEYIDPIKVECICLQIRKLLELIAMSSLVMNKTAFEEAQLKFQTMWNAKLILNDIKRIHGRYFPQSLKGTVSEIDDELFLDNADYEVLDENKFCKIYEKCGKLMHAENPYSLNESLIDYYVERIPTWTDLIFRTIKCHIVYLYGTDYAYAISLNGMNEDITYNLFKKKQSSE